MHHQQKIRDFIRQNLIVFDDEVEFTDSDNIFQLGYVNSLFAMKLLCFVEKEFDIKVENDEMEIKNFSSVENIVSLVNRKVKALNPI